MRHPPRPTRGRAQNRPESSACSTGKPARPLDLKLSELATRAIVHGTVSKEWREKRASDVNAATALFIAANGHPLSSQIRQHHLSAMTALALRAEWQQDPALAEHDPSIFSARPMTERDRTARRAYALVGNLRAFDTTSMRKLMGANRLMALAHEDIPGV